MRICFPELAGDTPSTNLLTWGSSRISPWEYHTIPAPTQKDLVGSIDSLSPETVVGDCCLNEGLCPCS